MHKEKEERWFQQWVVQLPLMAQLDAYKSFEEYKDQMRGANIDTRPATVISAEADAVEERLKGNNGT